jgi:DNA-binding response OmpR family regulator
MSSLLLLTNALQPSTEVLPALGLLLHNVRVAPAEGPALVDTPGADVILIDGRRDLPQVRSLCQLLRSTGPGCPLILVVTEGGLAAVTADWGIDDVLLDTAGPAEVEARLRLAMGRQQIVNDDSPMEIRNGDLSVDEATYSAKLKGRVLDLTFKEFELLKYLAQHPGRVFTRAQLLQEVWGYDYFGGTRTVDVHVRRLRAKLGPEHESLIDSLPRRRVTGAARRPSSRQAPLSPTQSRRMRTVRPIRPRWTPPRSRPRRNRSGQGVACRCRLRAEMVRGS